MGSLTVAVFLAFLFADASCGHWNYGDESHWSEKCRTGKSQSPINLDDKIIQVKTFDKFVFSHYNIELPAILKNNGHSVQVNVDVSVPRPNVKGGGLPKEYTLDHLHFHWQSEHTINGHRFPLEVHLVHYASMYNNLTNALKYPDGLAVLGVLYDISPDDDYEFQPIINVLGNVEKELNKPISASKTRLSSFLPRDTAGFFRYSGSLTTPDCTEVVIWTVFTGTMPISLDQVKRFEVMHANDGTVVKANFRSLQNLEGRTIYKKISPLPHGDKHDSAPPTHALAMYIILGIIMFVRIL